jgi:isoquinoline 1-oxidoreductase
MSKDWTPTLTSQAAPTTSITRREFLKRMGALGGGLIFYITVADPTELFGAVDDLNAYLAIGTEGRVKCFTGKIEMGQGVITSLAQMLADELDVPYDTVDMVMGDTDLCPYDRGTWGSMTTRFFGPPLREAAAKARAILIAMALEQLKVPVERLQTADGAVFDKANPGTRVTYAELTKGRVIEKHVKADPKLKDPSRFQVVGKPHTSRDTLQKVTGEAKFAGDIRLPGMMYASILRPPAHGARLRKVDTSGAKAVKGITVIEEGDLIAVLHENPDTAAAALLKITTEFTPSPSELNDRNIFEHLEKVAPAGSIESKSGDLAAGRQAAAEIFEAKYLDSYFAHAPMETHTALADVKKDRATVWAGTQSPFGVKDQVARALGLPSDKVHVIAPFVGGGFGGKSASAQAVEAARLSKIAGRPVQVAWSRAEEFFYDTFRPAAVVKITSGLDGSGRIVLWDYDVMFAGSDGAEQFYDIPNHLEVSRGHWYGGGSGGHPFAVGPWRAPGTNTNTFARESHIDIMAARAGVDPLKFRLDHLSNKKMRGVLTAAAEAFRWTPVASPSGRGFGVACGIRSGAYVATMAEVVVDKKTGEVKVLRVALAQDMGLCINPHGAKLQIEGCVTMGLGYALTEEIRFDKGQIRNLNFDTYEIPRFSMVPEIEAVIVQDVEAAPQGGGEPAIVCMGAVIANAIYDAVGVRLYRLPMTKERVLEALKKA